MPSPRIHKIEEAEIYFITITVINWKEIFISKKYMRILEENLYFYAKKYDVKVYAYVFMTNHIHLMIQSQNLISFMKRFKSYTTKIIIKELEYDGLLDKLKLTKTIWKSNNWPKLVYSNFFYNQKLNYIHNNPVKKQYVDSAEEWEFSSAKFYEAGEKGLIEISDHV